MLDGFHVVSPVRYVSCITTCHHNKCTMNVNANLRLFFTHHSQFTLLNIHTPPTVTFPLFPFPFSALFLLHFVLTVYSAPHLKWCWTRKLFLLIQISVLIFCINTNSINLQSCQKKTECHAKKARSTDKQKMNDAIDWNGAGVGR